MKNLIIIGAGGMGRVVYDLAKECVGYNETFMIKGFIDDNVDALDNFNTYPRILGDINSYVPEPEDLFICSMGGEEKKKCISVILNKNGEFLNLIHTTVRIGTNATYGIGNIFGPYSTIASDAVIGNYNLLQQFVIIGHDCVIGDWNRLDSHTMCVGGVVIENEVTVHTSAVLSHKVVIKNRAKVAACSLVLDVVYEDSTVFGNPARRLK